MLCLCVWLPQRDTNRNTQQARNDTRGHYRHVRTKTEQEQTELTSNKFSRLHFSRETTRSILRPPASLWSEPSARWSPSAAEQMKKVLSKIRKVTQWENKMQWREQQTWHGEMIRLVFTRPLSFNTYSIWCSRVKKLWGVDQLNGASMLTFRSSVPSWHLTIWGLSGRTGQKRNDRKKVRNHICTSTNIIILYYK